MVKHSFWIDYTDEEKDAYQRYLVAKVKKLLEEDEKNE